jgi:hypothetical protein
MIPFRAFATAVFLFFPAITAFASQGPGVASGTASVLEQSLLVGALIAAAGIGLWFRFRRC